MMQSSTQPNTTAPIIEPNKAPVTGPQQAEVEKKDPSDKSKPEIQPAVKS